jgi:hypothetical protein
MSGNLKIPKAKILKPSDALLKAQLKGIHDTKYPLQTAALFRKKNVKSLYRIKSALKGMLQYKSVIFSKEEEELLINAISIIEYVADNSYKNWTVYKQENNFKSKKELKLEQNEKDI